MTADAERTGEAAAPVVVTLAAYGRVVDLEVPEALVGPVTSRLPPGYTVVSSSGDPDRRWSLGPDGDVGRLWSEVELWVADQAEGRVFVHAGCVAIEGRAILVPGRTMTGKSTLTAALVRAGASYLSDEYAVLDAEGQVWPYPRDLSVREGGIGRRYPIEHFGGAAAEGPVAVALVASLRFEPGAAWDVEATSAAAGVLALLDNTVSARSHPAEALAATAAVARSATFLQGRRGDAGRAAMELLSAVVGRWTVGPSAWS